MSPLLCPRIACVPIIAAAITRVIAVVVEIIVVCIVTVTVAFISVALIINPLWHDSRLRASSPSGDGAQAAALAPRRRLTMPGTFLGVTVGWGDGSRHSHVEASDAVVILQRTGPPAAGHHLTQGVNRALSESSLKRPGKVGAGSPEPSSESEYGVVTVEALAADQTSGLVLGFAIFPAGLGWPNPRVTLTGRREAQMAGKTFFPGASVRVESSIG